jgi:hypothetical protein
MASFTAYLAQRSHKMPCAQGVLGADTSGMAKDCGFCEQERIDGAPECSFCGKPIERGTDAPQEEPGPFWEKPEIPKQRIGRWKAE